MYELGDGVAFRSIASLMCVLLPLAGVCASLSRVLLFLAEGLTFGGDDFPAEALTASTEERRT